MHTVPGSSTERLGRSHVEHGMLWPVGSSSQPAWAPPLCRGRRGEPSAVPWHSPVEGETKCMYNVRKGER